MWAVFFLTVEENLIWECIFLCFVIEKKKNLTVYEPSKLSLAMSSKNRKIWFILDLPFKRMYACIDSEQ